MAGKLNNLKVFVFKSAKEPKHNSQQYLSHSVEISFMVSEDHRPAPS